MTLQPELTCSLCGKKTDREHSVTGFMSIGVTVEDTIVSVADGPPVCISAPADIMVGYVKCTDCMAKERAPKA